MKGYFNHILEMHKNRSLYFKIVLAIIINMMLAFMFNSGNMDIYFAFPVIFFVATFFSFLKSKKKRKVS